MAFCSMAAACAAICRGNIPTFIHIPYGKMYDVKALDILIPEPRTIYVIDRGYVDFKRLYLLHSAATFFFIRAKSNTAAATHTR